MTVLQRVRVILTDLCCRYRSKQCVRVVKPSQWTVHIEGKVNLWSEPTGRGRHGQLKRRFGASKVRLEHERWKRQGKSVGVVSPS